MIAKPEFDGQAHGFVLAGGQSSRMGADKALELFHGIPLIQNALDILASAGLPSGIAGSRSNLSRFAEEIPDTFANAGPLGGVHAALSHSPRELNLFLPVDLPLMPASLLTSLLRRAMITGAPATACKVNGRLEPFPVILSQTVLPEIEARLQNGQTACHAAWHAIPAAQGSILDAVAVEYLVQVGQCAHPLGLPPASWFQSANTPAELAHLNRIYSARVVRPETFLK